MDKELQRLRRGYIADPNFETARPYLSALERVALYVVPTDEEETFESLVDEVEEHRKTLYKLLIPLHQNEKLTAFLKRYNISVKIYRKILEFDQRGFVLYTSRGPSQFQVKEDKLVCDEKELLDRFQDLTYKQIDKAIKDAITSSPICKASKKSK